MSIKKSPKEKVLISLSHALYVMRFEPVNKEKVLHLSFIDSYYDYDKKHFLHIFVNDAYVDLLDDNNLRSNPNVICCDEYIEMVKEFSRTEQTHIRLYINLFGYNDEYIIDERIVDEKKSIMEHLNVKEVKPVARVSFSKRL